MRALKTGSAQARNRAVWQHQGFATRAEQRRLAKVLPDFAQQDDLVSQVVHHLYMGYATVPPEEWKADVATIEPLFKNPSAVLRRAMTYEFANFPDPALDRAMKEALSDADAGVRSSAIKYWSVRRTAEGAALLIEALRDPYDHNKVDAVNALAQAPSLDAVPALLEHLRSSNDVLRKATQTALKAIQQYYDEQEQWRKWYEETKKKLPKDK